MEEAKKRPRPRRSSAKAATEKMKQVDSKGHYESDDETGFFFKQLKDYEKQVANLN